MRNIHYILLLFIFAFGSAAAQPEGSYRYADATQLWRLTDNAAGLSLDSSASRGFAALGAEHRSGSYHRVQEGDQRNALSFLTERYQQMGRYLYGYGRFQFDMDATKHRSWCDVLRPYNSNPLFSGSDVPARYDTQQFDFSAAVGTVALGAWRLGARLDYQVADLSRLRDPRSRSELLRYRLTPAATYTAGAHTLGLSGHYDRRKEKIPNMNTVQDDPNLKYYQMQGLEFAYGNVGDYKGFSRQWVDHQLGVALSYGCQLPGVSQLAVVTASRGSEDVNGTEKQSAGHYQHYRFSLDEHLRLSAGPLLHQLDVSAGYEQAYADAYLQQRVQTTDPATGLSSSHYETLVNYRKGYQAELADVALHYRGNVVGQQGAVGSYFGLQASASTAVNRHLLPRSRFRHTYADLSLEGGHGFLGDRLWADVAAGCRLSATTDDDLRLADATTDYARQVLLPDMAYYKANTWHGQLSLKYLFPLSVKGRKSMAYVRAYGQYLHASRGLSQQAVGISFGLYN